MVTPCTVQFCIKKHAVFTYIKCSYVFSMILKTNSDYKQNIGGCYLEWKGSDFCVAWTGILNLIWLQSVNTSRSNLRLQSVNKSQSSNPSPTAIQPNPRIRPPFVCRSLWRYVECSGISKCATVRNFCSQTFMRTIRGWRFIAGWLHVLLRGLPIFWHFRKTAKRDC